MLLEILRIFLYDVLSSVLKIKCEEEVISDSSILYSQESRCILNNMNTMSSGRRGAAITNRALRIRYSSL